MDVDKDKLNERMRDDTEYNLLINTEYSVSYDQFCYQNGIPKYEYAEWMTKYANLFKADDSVYPGLVRYIRFDDGANRGFRFVDCADGNIYILTYTKHMVSILDGKKIINNSVKDVSSLLGW